MELRFSREPCREANGAACRFRPVREMEGSPQLLVTYWTVDQSETYPAPSTRGVVRTLGTTPSE